mgnify:CR=1 FL=1
MEQQSNWDSEFEHGDKIASILSMDPEAMFLGGNQRDREKYYPAILGVTPGGNVCYSIDKIIEILSEDMDPFEAMEYFDYNINGAFVGRLTPVFVYTEFSENY